MATEQLETLGTEDAKWLGEYSQVHMNVFGTPLRVMDHGEGAHIWDVDGNEYLDFLAGIAVNALGYAHPKWVKAVSEQAAKAQFMAACEQGWASSMASMDCLRKWSRGNPG